MKKKFFIVGLLLLFSSMLFGCNVKVNVGSTTEPNTTSQPSSTSEGGTTTNPTQSTTEDTQTYSTIAEVLNGTVGDPYKTKGTVVGTTSEGALLYDEHNFIFVQLRTISVATNDFVSVSGLTNDSNGMVQFGIGTIVSKLSTHDTYTFNTQELIGSSITTYVNTYHLGDKIKLTGTLNISNNVMNLTIQGTDILVTLQTNLSSFGLSNMSGDSITVEGYVLNVTGTQPKHLNIIVTNVENHTDVPSTFPLTILEVNDLHGHIEQDASGMNGLSNMSYLINQIRNEDSLDDTILIGNGDMFQGTAVSNMTHGLAVVRSMNAMGFDAMGIGNHEFDWGINTILKYFDNNSSNGEANFPLLNGNIYNVTDHSLLSVQNGNVLSSTIIDKEGVQVGLISYVGDVYDSISYDKVANYEFDLHIADSVKQTATTLKQAGADVIVVSIHGGLSADIDSYSYNKALADLKDDQGNYLVDAVINGHTHSFQKGEISRIGGEDMPVVQAGSYYQDSSGNTNYDFGEIKLTIDLNTMNVVNYNVQLVPVSDAGTHYDQSVENIIDEYDDLGSDVLAVAGETVHYKSDLFSWTGNVMLAATGADIAISNTGGVRSTGNIQYGQNVTLSQLYEISPFDNSIWLVRATFPEISSLYNSDVFHAVKPGVNLNLSDTTTKYTVAIISYVYYWDELKDVRSTNDIDTQIYIRDILVEDIKEKGLVGQKFSPISHPEATIGLQNY